MSGFENFQVNSFEQLCINVANEHLQYYFNEHIFLQEEQDYRTEGVSCEKVEFQNNEDLIELFMGVSNHSCPYLDRSGVLFLIRPWAYSPCWTRNLVFPKRAMNHSYRNSTAIAKTIRDTSSQEATKLRSAFIITLAKYDRRSGLNGKIERIVVVF